MLDRFKLVENPNFLLPVDLTSCKLKHGWLEALRTAVPNSSREKKEVRYGRRWMHVLRKMSSLNLLLVQYDAEGFRAAGAVVETNL